MKRIILTSWGDNKTGRTHLALTFPQPIWYYDWNFGSSGVEGLDRVSEHFRFPIPPFATIPEQQLVFEKFKRDYRRGINDCPAGGTIVIDTVSELDEIVLELTKWDQYNNKYHGRQRNQEIPFEEFQMQQLDYGPRNAIMASVLKAPSQRDDLNGVFIHWARPKYEGKEQTGRLELAGYRKAPGYTEVTVEHKRGPGNTFTGVVSYSRLNPEIEGFTLPEVSYSYLHTILHGEAP